MVSPGLPPHFFQRQSQIDRYRARPLDELAARRGNVRRDVQQRVQADESADATALLHQAMPFANSRPMKGLAAAEKWARIAVGRDDVEERVRVGPQPGNVRRADERVGRKRSSDRRRGRDTGLGLAAVVGAVGLRHSLVDGRNSARPRRTGPLGTGHIKNVEFIDGSSCIP